MMKNKSREASKTKNRGFVKFLEMNIPHSATGNVRMPYVNAGGYITYIVR